MSMSERNEETAEPINPFARRPSGVGLSFRERLGVVALYLGLALLVGQHVVRSIGSAQHMVGGACSVPSLVTPSPGTILPSPPLAVGSRRPH
jgi:hypothetical protein